MSTRTTNPKRHTLLIVDDDEGMRDTLSAILKKDYRVKVATTGEEGLSVVKKEPIDLVLLDVRLPGIGGLEVLKIVRENYDLVEVITSEVAADWQAPVSRNAYEVAWMQTVRDIAPDDDSRIVSQTALRAELSVVPAGLGGGSPLATGLTTTGLIAINPAWPVEEGLAPLLDWCARRLARDPGRPGHASVTALTRD